jgi:hypothetical protein
VLLTRAGAKNCAERPRVLRRALPLRVYMLAVRALMRQAGWRTHGVSPGASAQHIAWLVARPAPTPPIRAAVPCARACMHAGLAHTGSRALPFLFAEQPTHAACVRAVHLSSPRCCRPSFGRPAHFDWSGGVVLTCSGAGVRAASELRLHSVAPIACLASIVAACGSASHWCVCVCVCPACAGSGSSSS